MSPKGILVVAALFGIAFALLALATRGYREIEALQSMEKATAAVRRDFPEAKPMPGGVLDRLMGDTPELAFLIDAREAEEFAESRLPGAVNLRDWREVVDLLETSPPHPEAVLVLYDSVGFRSAALARDLRDKGRGQVFYLSGGIFQWANEGRPLVDAEGEAAAKVHPYNKLWGRLLEAR